MPEGDLELLPRTLAGAVLWQGSGVKRLKTLENAWGCFKRFKFVTCAL
jgi:hypothetical protein